jgi:hypothetical protein|tara:strand:+ start:2225 stop:5956 length:3732 start_codon:yes stop_codon:yes gene_type:complete
MKESKVIRILPKEGTQNINLNIEQDFDYLEVLSLKILQKDAYRIFCSDKGVLVGKVRANGGFPIQNAKISVFIPIDNEDIQNSTIRSIYPFTTPNDTLPSGKRYNLLPRDKQLGTPADHVPVGTFPSKYDLLTNPTLKYIHEKYYKYTTTTNENGDYMFFGLPSGTHIIHCDVDISDIGTNSVTPVDLINLGYSPYLFNSDTEFKTANDLNQLAQVIGINNTTFVNPFWGDPDQCEFGLTRLDFAVSRFVNPKAYLIGSFYTDDDPDTGNNTYVPSACWQKFAYTNTEEIGFKAGVSRTVSAQSLRNGRQNGIPIGIIEAVRIGEDGPEYVGKWKTDENGSFVIPLPLNLGKKIWDEDLQGWRDDEQEGVATYADYRFKFYFEGQSDVNELGFADVKLNSKTNRGVFYAPNTRDGGGDENKYTFYAEPEEVDNGGYSYNMKDQFGLKLEEYRNYSRIRMGSFYTVGQNFNYIADFDSAVQDLGENQHGVNWYFEQTQGTFINYSHYYDSAYGGNSPDWVGNSVGTNPWIISRSYVFTDLYSAGDVTSRNLFPTNYLFGDYYMKAPAKQNTLLDSDLSMIGGFISNYTINREVEASYRGLGFDSGNTDMELVNGAGDSSFGNAQNLDNSNGGPQLFGRGEEITNAIDTTISLWYDNATMDGCIGCLTFGSYIPSGNYLDNGQNNNGSWFNVDATPYYGQTNFSLINPSNTAWDGTTGQSSTKTITGNIMMGGFVATYAAKYALSANLITTKTSSSNDWVVVGLSYCDATVYDCNSNGNWAFSGATAYYGKTKDDGWCEDSRTVPEKENIAQIDFTWSGAQPADPVVPTYNFKVTEYGQITWYNILLKEGMGVRVTVRPTLSDESSNPVNNDRGSSSVAICYACTPTYEAGCGGREVSSFGVISAQDIMNYDNRNIEEAIHGSLYFPQYYVGDSDSECCSRSNNEPNQRWDKTNTISGRQRTENWQHNSLLYAGTFLANSSTQYKNYNNSGNDPLGGQTIVNAKYYNVNTIGETKITEITKDIPNYQQGVNQWASIDRHLPSSSANPTIEMNAPLSTRENNEEDFDTNGDGTGIQFTQHKYFAPYDNLLLRTSQQWPRDEGEDGSDILCPESTIPMTYDWVSSNWYNNLMYPVQVTYNPNGYLTFSNYHVFKVSPPIMSENALWTPWIRRVPKEWYDNNTFWWSTIQPGPLTVIGDTNAFNNDKGGNNAVVDAYPKRKYYFFSCFYNLSPAEKLKRILGYKTGLI